MMDVSAGVLFGIVSMLAFGLGTGIAQLPAKRIGSKRAVFFRGLFVSVLLLIPLVMFLGESNFSVEYMLIALAISVIGYVPLLTFYKALKVGKVGIVTPIANSNVVFTVLLSIIFFGERLSGAQIFSIISIILGIILVSLDFRDIRNSHLFSAASGIQYALVTCLLWGLVFFLFKIPVSVLGPFLASFMTEFGQTVLCGAHLLVSRSSFELPDKRTLSQIILVAFLGSIGLLSFNLGIAGSAVSIVAALMSSSPLVATLYGKFVYKEELTAQQYSAIVLILAGIAAISYF